VFLNRERAIAVMESRDVDAVIATTAANVYYLSDYGSMLSFSLERYGFCAAILPRSTDIAPLLIVREDELPWIAERPTWMPELRTIAGFDMRLPPDAAAGRRGTPALELLRTARRTSSSRSLIEAIVNAVEELGLEAASLGFDDPYVEARVRAELPRASIRGAANTMREIRLVKTAAELELLRHAQQINEAALGTVTSALVPGISLREVNMCWHVAVKLQGGDPVDEYGGAIDRPWLMSPDDSYQLKAGDHIHFEPTCTYRHYWADGGRVGCVGEASPRLSALYAGLEKCHREVVPRLRAGASTKDLRELGKHVVKDLMPDGFTPAVHSIGLDMYDQPHVYGEYYGDDLVLEAGMVVCYETLYFEFPWGSLSLEETYHIGDGEPVRLGRLPAGILTVTD
jgi:Xaa-Pro aminopeptidase